MLCSRCISLLDLFAQFNKKIIRFPYFCLLKAIGRIDGPFVFIEAIRIISEKCVVLRFIQRFLQRQADDRVISEKSIAFFQKIWPPI